MATVLEVLNLFDGDIGWGQHMKAMLFLPPSEKLLAQHSVPGMGSKMFLADLKLQAVYPIYQTEFTLHHSTPALAGVMDQSNPVLLQKHLHIKPDQILKVLLIQYGQLKPFGFIVFHSVIIRKFRLIHVTITVTARLDLFSEMISFCIYVFSSAATQEDILFNGFREQSLASVSQLWKETALVTESGKGNIQGMRFRKVLKCRHISMVPWNGYQPLGHVFRFSEHF